MGPLVTGGPARQDNGERQNRTRRPLSQAGHDPQKAAAVMLHVRPAVTGDLRLILRMIDETADWLRTKDTDQWARPWPSQEERDEQVRCGLEAGRTWVVEDDRIPMATITCEPD